jgi:hypothetical protein
MAEKAPKHPKRYGNKGKGRLLRDYKGNNLAPAGGRAVSVETNNQCERPQRLQRLQRLQRVQRLSTDGHAASRPATHPDNAAC